MSIEFEEYSSAEEYSSGEEAGEPRRLAGTDVLRGAMVVGTAIVVGAVLLIGGLGGDDESGLTSAIAVDGTDSEVTDADDDTAMGEETDGTLFDPMDPFPVDTGDESQDESDAPAVFGQPAPGEEDATSADDEPAPNLIEETDGTEVLPSEDTSAPVPDAAAVAEPAVRLPADVKVLVLNGIGTSGIAARGAAVAESAGYAIAIPKNAEPTPQASGIYFAEGYQREALDVAQAYASGLDALVVPLTANNAPIADTQSAHVIVVVGSDRVIEVP